MASSSDLEALPQEAVVPQEVGSDFSLRLQLLSLPGGWKRSLRL